MLTQMQVAVEQTMSRETGARVDAAQHFDDARAGRFWRTLRRRLHGGRTQLRSLQEAICGQTGDRSYVGVRNVPIEQIQGSEGRQGDFDAEFRPLHVHDKERWMGVYMAVRSGRSLPPVELIQVGDTYYVRDGHHRISAMRQMGLLEVEAEVLRWQPL